jgi:uncharacterized caspase-like protein
MSLLYVEHYPQTDQLLAAANEQFNKGAQSVALVMGNQIVGTILSRNAAQKALARQVAEHWIASPEMLKDLEASLEEKPEAWD